MGKAGNLRQTALRMSRRQMARATTLWRAVTKVKPLRWPEETKSLWWSAAKTVPFWGH